MKKKDARSVVQGGSSAIAATAGNDCAESLHGKKRPDSGFSGQSACLCLLLFFFCCWGAGWPLPVQAASALCPSGEVRVFLPAPTNSQVSRVFELVCKALRESLDISFRSHPLPGRGGSYATSRLLDEKGDGCFLVALQLPSFLLLSQSPNTMYQVDDICLVGAFASLPNALWVTEESPFRVPADLVAHARTVNETPGGIFTLAGVGSFTDQHLATLQFNRAAGVKSMYRPVVGSAEAIAAVQNGTADACWGYALAPDSMPGMRALAVASFKRSLALPGVPTLYEKQIDMENSAVFGLGMTAAATKDKQNQMGAALETALAERSFHKELETLGAQPLEVPFMRLPAYLGEWQRHMQEVLEEYALLPPPGRRR